MSLDKTKKNPRQRPSTSENQMNAPLCAGFVKAMREAFGAENVQVLYVKEGDVELGKK